MNLDENIDEGFLVDTEIDEGFGIDPNAVSYKVYSKKDEQGSIVDIWSTGNQALGDSRTEQEMMEDGYEFINEGFDGNIFGYAQINYSEKLHGKPLFDELRRPNFHDRFIGWTEEEKAEKYPPAKPQPTEQDLINADIYLQLAQLQMNSISVITIQSPRYDILKGYYDMGIYNNESMKVFVSCGWISSEEYEQITSRKYHEDML